VGTSQNLGVVGLFRQEKRYDIIANNLSNIETVGYKKDVPVFYKTLSGALSSSIAEDPVESVTNFQQGDLQTTQNQLDVAIEGEDFFKVKAPNGIRYTRNGNFHLNQDGVMVQSNGYPVLGNGREITVQGTHVVIDKDGSISVDGKNQGKIDLVTFPDLNGLKKEGQTLFKLTTEQEEVNPQQSQVQQGSLESSNVNALGEMIQMIDSARTVQFCTKLIQAEDDMNNRAVNDLAKV
jgi:flagellar basal-body rod protein FlgF